VRCTLVLGRHHPKLHNVTFQAPYCDLQDGSPLWSRIRGDANQLQQVLLNRMINVQRAITAERGHGAARVTLSPDGPHRVALTAKDDGPGNPVARRVPIIQPCSPTKPSDQGIGLDRSISAEIIKSPGGSLAVQNHERGGASNRMVLPSLAAADRKFSVEPSAPATMVEAVSPLPTQDGPKRRVLLLDDEAGIRKSVGRFLRRWGYQVTEVAEVEAALVALRQQNYEAIVSDLRLPGISGEEFFELVSGEFPAMVNRMVYTSGDTLREESQKFLLRSGCPALQKPYELAELVRLLEDLPSTPSPSAHGTSASVGPDHR